MGLVNGHARGFLRCADVSVPGPGAEPFPGLNVLNRSAWFPGLIKGSSRTAELAVLARLRLRGSEWV